MAKEAISKKSFDDLLLILFRTTRTSELELRTREVLMFTILLLGKVACRVCSHRTMCML